MPEMWQVGAQYSRWIGRLSHQSSNLSHPCNLLQKVVICALLNTGFKGMQVVNYPTNCQTTEVRLTKSSQKGSGCMHMDKQNTQFFLVILCSMRGNDIARVEGQWLFNRPNHSVPETQMTALRFVCALLIYFPPQNSIRDHCDIIYDIMFICSTLSVEKLLHMCRADIIVCLHICWHHHQNPQLL